MGVDTYVTSISYVTIHRDMIDKDLASSLEADQSFHKWLRRWTWDNSLKLKVIKGVSNGRFIFDREDYFYLKERLGHCLSAEEEEVEEKISKKEIQERKKLDFEWAAIILTEIHFDLDYDGPDHCSSFNPNRLRKLFSDPDQDLEVRNEVWARQS